VIVCDLLNLSLKAIMSMIAQGKKVIPLNADMGSEKIRNDKRYDSGNVMRVNNEFDILKASAQQAEAHDVRNIPNTEIGDGEASAAQSVAITQSIAAVKGLILILLFSVVLFNLFIIVLL